jgi:hypothetical protein
VRNTAFEGAILPTNYRPWCNYDYEFSAPGAIITMNNLARTSEHLLETFFFVLYYLYISTAIHFISFYIRVFFLRIFCCFDIIVNVSILKSCILRLMGSLASTSSRSFGGHADRWKRFEALFVSEALCLYGKTVMLEATSFLKCIAVNLLRMQL